METMMVDGFLRALADPRFQELVAEFYQVRGTVQVREEALIRTHIGSLLDTIQSILEEQYSLRVVGGDRAAADKLKETIGCVEGVHDPGHAIIIMLAGSAINSPLDLPSRTP